MNENERERSAFGELRMAEAKLRIILKLINNSSRWNKENHNREEGLDTRS